MRNSLFISSYHGNKPVTTKMEEAGYPDKKTIDNIEQGDIFEIAEELFSKKLNVLLQHNSNGSVILWVDDKNFKQR